MYNFCPAFPASLCGQLQDSAAEVIDVLLFLSSDAAALGPWPSFQGSWSCTEQRHWVTSVERPRGSPWWPCFLPSVVTKLSPAPFSGDSGLRECSAIQRYLLRSSLPQIISTHSSLHPWKKMGWSSPLLPQPASPDFYATNSFIIVTSSWDFFSFWWHFSHGNRKIPECFVKISIVCLFLSLTCMKEIVHCLIFLCKWEIALTSKHSEVLLILLSLVFILSYILFGDLGQAIY